MQWCVIDDLLLQAFCQLKILPNKVMIQWGKPGTSMTACKQMWVCTNNLAEAALAEIWVLICQSSQELNP